MTSQINVKNQAKFGGSFCIASGLELHQAHFYSTEVCMGQSYDT